MTTEQAITLFHAPNTRSLGILTLLEELNAPYELHVLDIKKGEHKSEAYLALNPMGKVPAVKHGDALITETVAIYLYLADLFPEAGLAPTLGDPLRGPYLRWMVYYAACFEPAVVDKAVKREPAPPSMCPYGDYDTVMNTVINEISKGPYLFGDRMTAADVLWGVGLTWTSNWKLVPDHPAIQAYVERHGARAAVAKAKARDAEIAAAQASGG